MPDSENEIYLRLKSNASAKTAFLLCKKYGLITDIRPDRLTVGELAAVL